MGLVLFVRAQGLTCSIVINLNTTTLGLVKKNALLKSLKVFQKTKQSQKTTHSEKNFCPRFVPAPSRLGCNRVQRSRAKSLILKT